MSIITELNKLQIDNEDMIKTIERIKIQMEHIIENFVSEEDKKSHNVSMVRGFMKRLELTIQASGKVINNNLTTNEEILIYRREHVPPYND